MPALFEDMAGDQKLLDHPGKSSCVGFEISRCAATYMQPVPYFNYCRQPAEFVGRPETGGGSGVWPKSAACNHLPAV
jgi:hypothetical protein